MSTTEIELKQVTTALVEFDKVAAGLALLTENYQGVLYEVRAKEGMTAALEARRAIRTPRLEVERLRKAAKAPILELGRKLDNEAKRITTALEELENPIHAQITAEQDRLHNEAIAKATAERERVETLEARLDAIRTMPYEANGLSIAQIEKILAEARATVIGEDWQEFADKARGAMIATMSALEGVLAKAQAAEAEKLRIVAEREELAKLRKEQAERERVAEAARKVEADRVAAEQKAEAEKLATERQVFADEQRAADENRERNEMAMQELQAIHHQLMIADTGRAPYIKGGTSEGARLLIKQTEDWQITEEKFGVLTASAEKVKQSTLIGLREKLRQFTEQEAASAEPEIVSDLTLADDDVEPPEPVQLLHPTITRPKDHEIIQVLIDHFKVERVFVEEWIADMKIRQRGWAA